MDLEFYLGLMDNIDLAIFTLLFAMNVVLWDEKINLYFSYELSLIFLGLIFPSWSIHREVERNMALNSFAINNFELLHSYFVCMLYWFAMWLQVVYLSFKPNPISVHEFFRNISNKE